LVDQCRFAVINVGYNGHISERGHVESGKPKEICGVHARCYTTEQAHKPMGPRCGAASHVCGATSLASQNPMAANDLIFA
jgi:hypothetical protein